MKTITIQFNDDKALRLLENLEALNLIQIIKKPASTHQELSKKFADTLHLSDEKYNEFQQHLDQSRNEWERDI
jgi:hypothetical protein